jgi:hypothetical protein
MSHDRNPCGGENGERVVDLTEIDPFLAEIGYVDVENALT